MKFITFFAVLSLLGPLLAADASKPVTDPFAGAFFPPEMILLARDRIALTQEQADALHARMETTQSRSDELRAKLERETAALAALAKSEHVDEAAVIAQLDKVLDLEREVKHLHVGALAAIKNLLTPEQQAKLGEIAKDGGKQLTENARKRLTEKAGRVMERAKEWAASGRDPSAIARTMEEKFKPLIQAGKVIEAEAVLDSALKLLGQDGKTTSLPTAPAEAVHQRVAAKVERVTQAVQKMAESGRDPSAILKTMGEKVGPLLDSGKFGEAEAEIDRVLTQLAQDTK
jgi:Spy/CpxP family protein refolding chaperone